MELSDYLGVRGNIQRLTLQASDCNVIDNARFIYIGIGVYFPRTISARLVHRILVDPKDDRSMPPPSLVGSCS